MNGTLFFGATDGVSAFGLWKSEGTGAGTILFQDIVPGSDSSIRGGLTVVGALLFCVADDGLTGIELWSLPITAAPAASRGDRNADGILDAADLVAILLALGSTDPQCDVDKNGVVALADVTARVTLIFQ